MRVSANRFRYSVAGSVDCVPSRGLEKVLGRDSGVQIALINRQSVFLFKPMLPEVAASDLDITHIVNHSVFSRDLVQLHHVRPSTVASIEGEADAALFAS